MRRKLVHVVLLSSFLAICCSAMADAATSKIHVVIEESESHTQNEDNYYLNVLDFLLSKSKPEYGDYEVVVCRDYLTQARQFRYLRSPDEQQSQTCKIDLLWSSPGPDRNKGVLAVNIPLELGLNGIRTLVVTKESAAQFKNVRSIEDLSDFVACQGIHWPDTRILESSGLRVLGSVSLDSMYGMLKRERCDYLPTAIHEVNEEIKQYGASELSVLPNIVLRYNLPTYFFVNENNQALAQRLISAFENAIEDSSFFDFVTNHKVTREAFSIKFDNNVTILDLQNAELSSPAFAPQVTQDLVSEMLFNTTAEVSQ